MAFIAIGRVIATRGVQGEIRFRYYNNSETTLLGYRFFFADKDGRKVPLTPSRIEFRPRHFLIQFEGLHTPDAVSFLIGKELFISEEDLPQLDDGEYYQYQLIGLEVFDEDGVHLGKVREIVQTKANDIMVIEGNTEVLVPMQEEFILGIDIGASSITVSKSVLLE